MIKILNTVLFSILTTISLFPQISTINYKETNNKLECELNLSPLPYSKEVKGEQTLINFSNFRDESLPGEGALATRDVIFALPSYSKVSVELNPVSINKIKGIPVTNPEVSVNKDEEVIYTPKGLKNSRGKEDLIQIKGYLWIRNYYCVHLKINQYRFNNDIIEELQKAKLVISVLSPGNANSVNFKEAKEQEEFLANAIINYRSGRQLNRKFYEPMTSNFGWIDFTKTYLKIGTAKDGLYRIKKSDLEGLGINTSLIPLNSYQLYMKGNQIPILTKSSGTTLDDAGYIEFFGLRNMGDSYRDTSARGNSYKEYLNRYSDTTIYWLTWNGDPGMRTAEQSSALTSADTIFYSAELVHYEEDVWLDYSIENLVRRQFPQWLENQTWVWGQQAPGTVSLSFKTTDVYPNKIAKAFYKVQDYYTNVTHNAHIVGLSINSDPVISDSIPFDRYAQHVAKAEFNSNKIVSGTNYLKAISYTTLATSNALAYDWYEVEYPRYLKAVNDSLKFIINDLVSQGLYSFRITNFVGANPVIYKYDSGIKKILNFTRIADKITFTDTVQPGSKYYLINESKINSPVYYYKKNFTDLSASSNKADYILITHPLFMTTANQYVTFINQNYSVDTKAVNVYDIYDQFNYGFFSPEPIKTFLKTAYLNWQSPKPSYLLLVGDATYDYYGNKSKNFGIPLKINLVPSFGEPVSDSWFSAWDTTGAVIPHLFTGRVPAGSVAEFQHFYDKHISYLSSPFDDWNKNYILLSSGKGNDPYELSFLKQINDGIALNSIVPAPIGGNVEHLYKTYSPPSNFGPYTSEQVNNVFSNGGLIISYLGHSGTQVWDNGISDVTQLKNSRNRSPFISDFGCSTGKFAEPDIKAFSKLFVCSLDGDAIGYIGNATLGFSSTTSIFPPIFYRKLLVENSSSLGSAHVNAKIAMLTNYGSNDVYGVFIYGNTLFTDPIIKLKIPPKPNLSVNSQNVSIDELYPDDSMDSVTVKFNYFNYGKVTSDTFKIEINHVIDGISKGKTVFTRTIPFMSDSILISFPVKGVVGNHQVEINLDRDNQIDEIYENDNTASFSFNVTSSTLRLLSTDTKNNICNGTMTLINPVSRISKDTLIYEVSTDAGFSSSLIYQKKLDTAFTKINIAGLLQGKRYWLRTKLNTPNGNFGAVTSFIYDSASVLSYYLGDSLSFSTAQQKGVVLKNNSIVSGSTRKELKIYSAGYYDGGYAIIEINGNDYLVEGQLEGFHVVVFSDSSFNFEYTRRFNYWEDPNFATNFKVFLDTIPANKIVAFATAGSAVIGMTSAIKTDLKSFGSKYADIIDYQYSWAMIGKKGSVIGSVPEKYTRPGQGFVILDSVTTIDNQTGSVFSSQIGPAKKWKKLVSSYTALNGSSIQFIPVGIKQNGTKDTLAPLVLVSGEADLSVINAATYPYIQLLINFNKAGTPPVLSNVKVEFDNYPEIGTNYQAVSVSQDTVTYGENITVNFRIFNEGSTSVDTIKYRVDRIRKDNTVERLAEKTITGFTPGTSTIFSQAYNTASDRSIIPLSTGPGSFVLSIDPDNKVSEFFKDNNTYSIPFYIKGDTTHPNIKIMIDGGDITDGDYISSSPVIKIELDDPSLIPVTDTSAITMTLNGSPVYFRNNGALNYHFNNANPKMVVEYTPHLPDGVYIFKVKGKNNVSISSDTISVSKSFQVVNEAQLINVFNYPNPFSKDTYFTFQWTQKPDDVRIRIFTIAGRLVREITKNSDFNNSSSSNTIEKIYWDGKDADGDILANGVYLYKMIMKSGNKTVNATQKCAIIK